MRATTLPGLTVVKNTISSTHADSAEEKTKKPSAADAKKSASEKSESVASDPAEKKDAKGPEGVKSLTEAAKIVVQQLKTAAAAVGLQSGVGEEEPPKKKRRRKKKTPQPPMYRMRDGTRIAGHADVQTLRVTTAYGSLEVPIADIVQVRFSSPRDAQLGERIRALVEQLGSDEYDLREEASEGLRGIGVAALEILREAARSEDQEVKTRAEKLVAELEEELEELEEDERPFLVALRGEEDEVVTLKFTAVGRVDLTRFSVSTPYGQLELDRNDILSIVFRPPPFRQHKFRIGGAKAYAGNNKWVDTGLKLTQGSFLKIIAAGSLNLSNYGTNCSPDGAPGLPTTGLDSFPVGALVAKIGSKGKAFLVGSEYEGTANATGKLQLGISFKSGTMRGQFEVEVEVEIEAE